MLLKLKLSVHQMKKVFIHTQTELRCDHTPISILSCTKSLLPHDQNNVLEMSINKVHNHRWGNFLQKKIV